LRERAGARGRQVSPPENFANIFAGFITAFRDEGIPVSLAEYLVLKAGLTGEWSSKVVHYSFLSRRDARRVCQFPGGANFYGQRTHDALRGKFPRC
jgi:hypothetical protein